LGRNTIRRITVRKFTLLTALIVLAASVSMSAAQTSTPAAPTNSQTTTTQATQTPSSVNVFYVACENQGVINFDGTMQAGYDIYYQLFNGPNASGTALTTLRQVTVNGSYAVSDQVSYASGQTLASGGTGSARVTIAREGSPTSTTLDTTVNDLQDGCNNPRNPLVSSTDAGSGSTTTTEPTQGVRSPTGGFLSIVNPVNPLVVIGVPAQPGRSNKPGEVFAECDQYRRISDPGILYDNDNIMIFWSWFAKTEEQIQQHLANSVYEVKFQTAPLKNVLVSPVQKIGTNFWVFYTAQVGNLSPGRYGVEFKLSWTLPIEDGYDSYGPGTDNFRFNSTCTFEIQRTPFGDQAQVQYNGMYSIDR
jgi:hypothetical protein